VDEGSEERIGGNNGWMHIIGVDLRRGRGREVVDGLVGRTESMDEWMDRWMDGWMKGKIKEKIGEETETEDREGGSEGEKEGKGREGKGREGKEGSREGK
jgi:hypothetical protein